MVGGVHDRGGSGFGCWNVALMAAELSDKWVEVGGLDGDMVVGWVGVEKSMAASETRVSCRSVDGDRVSRGGRGAWLWWYRMWMVAGAEAWGYDGRVGDVRAYAGRSVGAGLD